MSWPSVIILVPAEQRPTLEAARTFLRDVLPGVNGLVDTDHSEILPASGFLALMERHPEWDWRRQPGKNLP